MTERQSETAQAISKFIKPQRGSALSDMDEGSIASSDAEGYTSHETGTSGFNRDGPELFQIAASETKAVQRSKVCVYLLLGMYAMAASALSWFYVRQGELEDFEYQFNLYAEDLLDGAENGALTLLRQLQTLSTSVTSHSLYKTEFGEVWPYAFVATPHFYARTEELGTSLDSQLILFAPIVMKDQQEDWDIFLSEMKEKIIFKTFGPRAFERNFSIPASISPIPQFYEEDYDSMDFWLPVLQYGPHPISTDLINLDLLSHPAIRSVVTESLKASHGMLSAVADFSFLTDFTNTTESKNPSYDGSPRSMIVEPVFSRFEEPRTVTGFVMAVEPWEAYFSGNVPEGIDGFVVYIQNTCGGEISYIVKERELEYSGATEVHDLDYDYLGVTGEFATFDRYNGAFNSSGIFNSSGNCDYRITVYPSKSFENKFRQSEPYVYAAVVFAMFLSTASIFALYDFMVQRRQKKVLSTAERTTKVVESLFPKSVGDRILAEIEESEHENNGQNKRIMAFLAKNTKKDLETQRRSDPIAELYTETTIMFCDIAGFTAWSSAREPKQVFILLETIYAEFDIIARRRGVFKVETVGDCYVAVAGLPEPCKDHYLVMARFARDCLQRFQSLTHALEIMLGPDTADLHARIGLHSGSVTAGVLRGERARFQLFGDTMNTASRMESTGRPNRIQISEETADMLAAAGKDHWFRKRDDLVEAKGKGTLQTYWLFVRSGEHMSCSLGNDGDKMAPANPNEDSARDLVQSNAQKTLELENREKQERLVRWNTEILSKSLKAVCRKRLASGMSFRQGEINPNIQSMEQAFTNKNVNVLNEVQDVIRLPAFCKNSEKTEFALDPIVKNQLGDFVSTIASMYRDHPFHNFEHASHVTMSVVKLMSRIVRPKIEQTDVAPNDPDGSRLLHDHTYGITSDPLTQFASAFSALIHDVDHPGVPNITLVKEESPLALAYNNKSVAEQNSVNLAWSVLMKDKYKDLRLAIYTTEAEFREFRQLVVNCVMATDIMDKDLSLQRKERWMKAFSGQTPSDVNGTDFVNRRATIVLEHLIQASDVAHTMQHWHVYKKWNQRLFEEMYCAYKHGRSEKDPSVDWYHNEISFFEFYVIPLANKLKECGVFGVSGDEYLNYAVQNKREWEANGKAVVHEFIESAQRLSDETGDCNTELQHAVLSSEDNKKSGERFIV